jgi:ribonuclease D
MADPAVEKVMHAPSGDLAAFVLQHDVRPVNVFDTQLAAGFAGYGGTLSLERLLEAALKVRLRHDEGFTDWQRRPLTQAQIEYAADDVRHLLQAADALQARLQKQGRAAWVAEEFEARFGPEAPFVQDPDTAWRRVAGRGKVRTEGLAALRAAAAWREREARRRDLPAAWLMKDATLVELARRRPATPKDAEGIRGLQIKRGRQLDELLATLADPGPPPEADAELPGDVRRRIRVVLPLASAVLQARCAAAGVASELVATRADLESFIAGQALDGDRPHPLLTGWRRELAGDSLVRLLQGEISLRVLPGPPHVAES